MRSKTLIDIHAEVTQSLSRGTIGRIGKELLGEAASDLTRRIKQTNGRRPLNCDQQLKYLRKVHSEAAAQSNTTLCELLSNCLEVLPEAGLVGWIELPHPSFDPLDLWGYWKAAFEDLFSYQPERDDPDDYKEAHYRCDREERSEMFLGGYFDGRKFSAIYQFHLDKQESIALATWVGVLGNLPAPAWEEELGRIRKRMQGRQGGTSVTIVYEADRPAKTAWASLQESLDRFLYLEQNTKEEAVLCLKRAYLFQSKVKSRPIFCSGGIFNYTQPDLRLDVVAPGSPGREMWLYVLPPLEGDEVGIPEAEIIVRSVYECVYTQFYRDRLGVAANGHPYFKHVENLIRDISWGQLNYGDQRGTQNDLNSILKAIRAKDRDLYKKANLRTFHAYEA